MISNIPLNLISYLILSHEIPLKSAINPISYPMKS